MLLNIKEAGRVLEEKFSGSFVNVIKMADKSATKLIQLVVDNFTSYDDTAIFEGKKGFFEFENFGVTGSFLVYIYKRVQILVADLWACFEGQGYGAFYDIDKITMFADYRVPQVSLLSCKVNLIRG